MAKRPTKAERQAALAGGQEGGQGTAPNAGEGAEKSTETSDNSAATAPAAPGDDPEAVHERRMQRLERIVEGAQFESGTAKGDLVELMVDLVKHQPKLWPAMVQSERRDVLKRIEQMVGQALKKVVRCIAQAESNFVEATITDQFTVKGDAIEGKFKISSAGEGDLIDIRRLAGHDVVIISADDKRFSGKRKDIDNPPDQLDIAFADDKPKAAPAVIKTPEPVIEHPTDDSDLAGDDEKFDVAAWRAGLKEGDKVSVAASAEADAEIVEGTISFVDGDNVDIEIDAGGDLIKRTVTRDDVTPAAADVDDPAPEGATQQDRPAIDADVDDWRMNLGEGDHLAFAYRGGDLVTAQVVSRHADSLTVRTIGDDPQTTMIEVDEAFPPTTAIEAEVDDTAGAAVGVEDGRFAIYDEDENLYLGQDGVKWFTEAEGAMIYTSRAEAEKVAIEQQATVKEVAEA